MVQQLVPQRGLADSTRLKCSILKYSAERCSSRRRRANSEVAGSLGFAATAIAKAVAEAVARMSV